MHGSRTGEESGHLSDVLRNCVSLLSAGAGAIHFAVIQSHFEEYWVFGTFFAVFAWLQILWALLLIGRPTRPVALAGIVINGVIAAVWVVSRTVGIPLGPESGTPEMAEYIDVISTVLEVLAIVGASALLLPRATRRVVGRGLLVSSTVVVGMVVAVLTTTAIISYSPDEKEIGAAAGAESGG